MDLGAERRRLRPFETLRAASRYGFKVVSSANDAAERRCVDPRSLFLANPNFTTPPEAMRAFVAAMPSVHVLATLRDWKHRDLTHPWEQHDKVDLMSLSVAIPYCDLVITERRWAHLANASGLARLDDTSCLSGRKALVDLAG